MEFVDAQIRRFYVEGDRPQFRARVVFEDEAGPVSFERVTDTPGEATLWTNVAIQAVPRGLHPPA